MIRSIVFGFLTALIATLVAQKSNASFLEAPLRASVVLEWTQDAGSIQALLYSALSNHLQKNSSINGGVSPLSREGESLQLKDNQRRFFCEAATLGRLAVESYRCDIHLPAPEFDSKNDSLGVATVLFDALSSLHEVHGDELSQLSRQENGRSTLIRLVDTGTSSRIACEKTHASGSVRCRVDIRP